MLPAPNPPSDPPSATVSLGEEEEEEGVEAETFRCIFCDISCPGTKTSSILAAVQAKFNNNAIYKLHTPYSLIHSHYLHAHPHSSKV